MKLNLIFILKKLKVSKFFLTNFNYKNSIVLQNFYVNKVKFFFKKIQFKKVLKKFFSFKNLKKKTKGFFFINRFIQYFLESVFKKKILINIKKGSNKLFLKQTGNFYFFNKFFKKNLKTSKQIIGILYYSILLKDSFIFSNFFKKKLENINIKLHKKLLLGLKKTIRYFFCKNFIFFGLRGIFLNIKGKLGVSGNAKKRRYFFYFGNHSLTKKTIKFSHKYNNV